MPACGRPECRRPAAHCFSHCSFRSFQVFAQSTMPCQSAARMLTAAAVGKVVPVLEVLVGSDALGRVQSGCPRTLGTTAHPAGHPSSTTRPAGSQPAASRHRPGCSTGPPSACTTGRRGTGPGCPLGSFLGVRPQISISSSRGLRSGAGGGEANWWESWTAYWGRGRSPIWGLVLGPASRNAGPSTTRHIWCLNDPNH